jgi:hypothetical protein
MRRATQRPGAPWHGINAADPRARNLEVADKILTRFRAHYRTHKTVAPIAKPRRTAPLRAAGLQPVAAYQLAFAGFAVACALSFLWLNAWQWRQRGAPAWQAAHG